MQASNQSLLTIGVLSDTHLPYRLPKLPLQVMGIFDGVDLIMHAGDVDEIAFLQPLKEIAPLYAVRGNIHIGDFSLGGRDLPAEMRLKLLNYRVVMTHGHRPGIAGWAMKIPDLILTKKIKSGQDILNAKIARRLSKSYPDADVVIFGHTHCPYAQAIGKTLFFNPGAVVSFRREKASVGLLRLKEDRIEAEIIPL